MNASKKLIASFAALVVAVALAVTSTYAWFSMSAEPSIEGLNVNVTAGDGLLISLTGAHGSYKAVLTGGDLDSIFKYTIPGEGEEEDDIVEKTFDAVYYDAAEKKFKKLTGINTEYNSAVYADADINTYLEFDIHFLADVKTTIKLLSTGTNVSSVNDPSQKKAEAWNDEAFKLIGETGKNKYGTDVELVKGNPINALAANAMRVSFTVDTTTTIWEPNNEKGFPTGNLALDYYNYMNNTALTGAPAAASADISDVELLKLNDATIDGTATVYKGIITVRVWLEGWDGDCFDSIKRDKVTINLQFVGSNPA